MNRYNRAEWFAYTHLDDETIEELAEITGIIDDDDIAALIADVTEILGECPMLMKSLDNAPRPANIRLACSALSTKAGEIIDLIDEIDSELKRLIRAEGVNIHELRKSLIWLDEGAIAVIRKQEDERSRKRPTRNAFRLCVSGLVDVFKKHSKVDASVDGDRPISIRRLAIEFVYKILIGVEFKGSFKDVKIIKELDEEDEEKRERNLYQSRLARMIPASLFKDDDYGTS
jgi:hypothetical protein